MEYNYTIDGRAIRVVVSSSPLDMPAPVTVWARHDEDDPASAEYAIAQFVPKSGWEPSEANIGDLLKLLDVSGSIVA